MYNFSVSFDNSPQVLSETEKYIYKNINRVGELHPGHLYGLPKLHKDIENPPLRPIISMSGTITHDVSKFLNGIIRPYIDMSHSICSSDEALVNIQTLILDPGEKLVSLDVESLFTNVLKLGVPPMPE